MTRFVLIRHEFSVANEDRFFAGASDVPLTELGRRQGEIVSRYVAERYAVDAIYPFHFRAPKTPLRSLPERRGCPFFSTRGLREIYGGKRETLSFAEIAKKITTNNL